jgi:hypothetical protein
MVIVLLVLGSYLIAPLITLIIMSFNVAPDVLVPPYEFGLTNWLAAWQQPLLLESLWNSFVIWFLTVVISLPIAVAIAWVLAARQNPMVVGARVHVLGSVHVPNAFIDSWLDDDPGPRSWLRQSIAQESRSRRRGTLSTYLVCRASSGRDSCRTVSPTR